MAGRISIWENPGEGGRGATFTSTTGQLTDWEYRSADTIKIEGFNDTDWNCFFESTQNFGDDQLYIQGNGELSRLGSVVRPHGNNNWADRIASIRFGLAPDMSNPRIVENSTRISHGSRRYAVGTNGFYELDSGNPLWGGRDEKDEKAQDDTPQVSE